MIIQIIALAAVGTLFLLTAGAIPSLTRGKSKIIAAIFWICLFVFICLIYKYPSLLLTVKWCCITPLSKTYNSNHFPRTRRFVKNYPITIIFYPFGHSLSLVLQNNSCALHFAQSIAFQVPMSYNSGMKQSYTVDPKIKQKAIQLYQEGFSGAEIKDALNLTHCPRQIQRWMKQAGVIRTIGDAFRNAVTRGRMGSKFRELLPHKKSYKRRYLPAKTRYAILSRDNFTCRSCGARPEDGALLEVDHIDENTRDHHPDNLQTLCHYCNSGKSHLSLYPYYFRGNASVAFVSPK